MPSSITMTPCPKTDENKKMFSSQSLQLHRQLMQNPAYSMAIPALLELQAGRALSTNADEQPIKLEVLRRNETPTISRNFVPEFCLDFKTDSIPNTTLLNYHPITAFNVGGELRLCLPQVMNSVLKNYSLQQIEHKINELNIYISRCSNEQAKCLKIIKVLPERVPYCGLITKSNAERLVYELLEKENDNSGVDERKRVALSSELSKGFGFRVYHECFGKCKGTIYPALFVEPEAKCIECLECKSFFAPNKFVCHAHRGHESLGICHWGFDSANWRCYIQISKDQDNSKELDSHLEQLKNKTFDLSDMESTSCTAKRKIESDGSDKASTTAVFNNGSTPKKKFPRVECDSGFGSSPDSNSNRSPTLSPTVLTSSSIGHTTSVLNSTCNSRPKPSLSSSSSSQHSTSPSAAAVPVAAEVDNGSHNHLAATSSSLTLQQNASNLANVIRNCTDLRSLGVARSLDVSQLAAPLALTSTSSLGSHKNGHNPSTVAENSYNSQQQQSKAQIAPSFTVIKSSEKLPAALFSQRLTLPNLNGNPELQRQILAMERAGNHLNSTSVGNLNSNNALQLQISADNHQHHPLFQRPSVVPASVIQQSSPAHPTHTQSVPSIISSHPAPPPLHSNLSVVCSQAPALTNSAMGGVHQPPHVTMATDLVSPELRMISQAMEVTIAKMSSQCSPPVKMSLDQLVELLKEQQKQYLKDFANTHQENERLSFELKTKEKELNDTKMTLSRLQQQMEHANIELQTEKSLRLRNELEIAQVLRHQQAIGTYHSLIQQQQQQQKAIRNNSTSLSSEPSISKSSGLPRGDSVHVATAHDLSQSITTATTAAAPKPDIDWSSLSPATDVESDKPPIAEVEEEESSPRRADEEDVELKASPKLKSETTEYDSMPSPNHVDAERTLPPTPEGEEKTNEKSPIPPTSNVKEEEVKNEPPTAAGDDNDREEEDCDTNSNGAPSPSQSSEESTSQLVIVDC